VRNNVLCEPGKLGDYVTSGVPVIAPAFPTIEPVVRELDIGVCFARGEPPEIARAIMTVLKKGKLAWRDALQDASDELIWETQEAGFLYAVSGRQQ
jgi:hypothetical protein